MTSRSHIEQAIRARWDARLRDLGPPAGTNARLEETGK